jgi:hypothetical protein
MRTLPSRRRDQARHPERGSGVVLVVLVLGLGVVALSVVLVTTRTVHARARAQHAADAAVLAALVEGAPGADRVARANGATVVWSSIGDDAARIEVEVHGVRARARAVLAPSEVRMP